MYTLKRPRLPLKGVTGRKYGKQVSNCTPVFGEEWRLGVVKWLAEKIPDPSIEVAAWIVLTT